MADDAYTPQLHELPAKRKGERAQVGWCAKLRTFFCIVSEDGAATRYGTSPRQYVRPEQLFAAIRPQWAWNEPDEQMVHVLLCMDRAAGPPELAPLPWEQDGRGR